MEKSQLHQLLNTEDEQLQKLNAIVIKALEEEKLLANKLQEFEEAELSFGKRLADRVAQFAGSWKFIIIFICSMLCWIAINLFFLTRSFDPYPFILLNLLLSTIAAIQAPVILMSQNRKEQKDRQRAINDYLINLKSEIEIRNVHQKLDLLMAEQMKTLFHIQKVQMEAMEEIKESIEKISINIPAADQ